MKPIDDFTDLVGGAPAEEPAPETKPSKKAKTAEEPAVDTKAPEEPAPPDLAALDPAEASVLAAHHARQKAWAEEAKHIFHGPSEEEKRRTALLDELAQIDARNAEERNALAKAAEKREAAEKATALRAENNELAQRIKDNEAEAKRLDALAKG